jgi:hypothetical protein
MADHPSPIAGDVEQLRDLCLLPDAEQLELLRDAVPGRDAATAVQLEQRRGRGRPAGSLNRRNAKFREQLLAIAPHPALALARAYATPVELLAAKLGCSLYEAAQLGIRAAAELLPYIEGKQPISVDVRRRADVVMIMAGGPNVGGDVLDAIASEVGEGMTAGIDWETAEIEELLPSLSGSPLQAVSPGEAEQSGD